ncbi:transposable element Tcb2 transposase [Trichonephila clavipes]|uniref:Transposable element Tcb2 transposase n=1 Tax=Trichonephila clavipes TaxID=2585209 RepID=A0A8X6SN51_TRICX|nr:transposable element Tcb2 transposase [Trichonephila clavipes]
MHCFIIITRDYKTTPLRRKEDMEDVSSEMGGGQLDEWKWDCRRLMLLDVSMCSATLGSIPIRRFCVQKTCSRPITSYNTCRRPFSSSFGTKEKNHYCAAARLQTTFKHQEKNLRYYGAKSSSQCRASTDLEEQRTRYHQSNTVERHSYRGGGILVWAGISLGGHTDLHVFHGGTVTGLRYRDEILDPYVRPYAAAIGNDFILMDDNARPHRARIVEEGLEDHGLERMEWPALDLQT